MSRPEWVKCIQKIKGKSFCGIGNGWDWMFGDLGHAERNVAQEGRLVPCNDCLTIAKRADG